MLAPTIEHLHACISPPAEAVAPFSHTIGTMKCRDWTYGLLLPRTPQAREAMLAPTAGASVCLHLPTGRGHGTVFTYDRDYEAPRLDVWPLLIHTPQA